MRPQDGRLYQFSFILTCWTHFLFLQPIFIPRDPFIHKNFLFFPIGPDRPQDERIYQLLFMLSCWTHFLPLKPIFIPMGPWIANSIYWYLFYLAGPIFYSYSPFLSQRIDSYIRISFFPDWAQ